MKSEPEMDNFFWYAGCFCCLAALLYLLYTTITNTHPLQELLSCLPPCALYKYTGFYCPGCGGTRAFFALCHGNILESIYDHPLIFYTVFVSGIFMVSQGIARFSKWFFRITKNRQQSIPVMHFRSIYLYVAAILILINFLIKNGFILLAGIYLLS